VYGLWPSNGRLAQIKNDPVVFMVRRRRKNRGEHDELYARGKLAAADQLREWARIIHTRSPISESDGS
jgi:hypothetical protein